MHISMNTIFSIADDIRSDISEQDEPNVNKPDETIPGTKCSLYSTV